MRGRKPTPTAILKLRGSRWANRGDEPEPAPGWPDRPDWMAPEALLIWERFCMELEGRGTLYRADANAIARYAVTAAMWQTAAAARPSANGTKGREFSQATRWYVQLAEMLLKLEQEFGLTPASATRVRQGKPPIAGRSFEGLRLAD